MSSNILLPLVLLACANAQQTTSNEIEAVQEIELTPAPPVIVPTRPPLPPFLNNTFVQKIQNLTAAADVLTKPIRNILPKCSCSALTCECCVNFGFIPSNQRSACARLNANFNDLGVILDLVVDGNIISSNSLSPSNFPICASYPPIRLCYIANNIYLDQGKIKVCSSLEVNFAVTTLYNGKLPCIGWENGQIAVSEPDSTRTLKKARAIRFFREKGGV